MNLRLAEAFGLYFVRLPLRKSPTIVNGNALRLDWKKILPPEQCSYVLGNPPFVGKQLLTDDQNKDMEQVWRGVDGSGLLDYVTGWYKKAAEYIQGTNIIVGFVSTNSISQGEQVGALWSTLFTKYKIKIHFAHRTFPWVSEARGKAHVHVVVIGFATFDAKSKSIYDYQVKGEKVTVVKATNINPYLIEGNEIVITPRTNPICNVPPMSKGSQPTDNGNLIVEEKDRALFVKKYPEAKKYLRPLLCAEEYLYSIPRWCLWLVDADPKDLKNIPGIKIRLEAVREFRKASKKEPTRRNADKPSLFTEIRQPKTRFIVVPLHTSEHRKYVPFGYFEPKYIVHNSCSAIPNATLYHFGMLSSSMHMAWMRQVCGRLESRYRYSNKLVYNNYPWPLTTSPAQHQAVETTAQAVLDARKEFPNSTLADLYDPLSMPPKLVKAHAELDKAVDLCYRSQPFISERQRVEYLFWLYEKLTAPLYVTDRRKRPR
jgi:hypothetical protein